MNKLYISHLALKSVDPTAISTLFGCQSTLEINVETNHHLSALTRYHIMKPPTDKNIMEKGENAAKHYFLLFQQCFLPYGGQI